MKKILFCFLVFGLLSFLLYVEKLERILTLKVHFLVFSILSAFYRVRQFEENIRSRIIQTRRLSGELRGYFARADCFLGTYTAAQHSTAAQRATTTNIVGGTEASETFNLYLFAGDVCVSLSVMFLILYLVEGQPRFKIFVCFHFLTI